MKRRCLKRIRNYISISFLFFLCSATVYGQKFDLSTRPVKTDDVNSGIAIPALPTTDQQDMTIQDLLPEDVPLSGPVPESRIIPGERKISGVTKVIGVRVAAPDDIEPQMDGDNPPVPEKMSGSYTHYDGTNRDILTQSYQSYVFYCSETLPSGAEVTDVRYTIRIDDNGDESDFYPYDYEIWLSSQAHYGSSGYYYTCVWDNVGSATSHTDGGYDDDAENDTDINIASRSTSAFDGEDATEYFLVRIVDNFGSSGNGIIDWVYLYIYWEAPDPNLVADYTPSGWDGPIVVSSGPGTHTDADAFYIGQTYYIDFAIINRDQAITDPFTVELWIDGGYYNHWEYGSLNQNWYTSIQDQTKTWTTFGTHWIGSWGDSYNTITESNESDNQYIRYIQVYGYAPAPPLSSPANSANCQSTNVHFDWGSVVEAETYQILVDNNDDFFSPEVNVSGLTNSYYDATLDPNETYYWAVRGFNPVGAGYWSAIYHFGTAPPVPGTTEPDSPVQGATCRPVNPTLHWDPVSGAATYAFQVDDNDDFSSPLYDYNGIGSTEYAISGLSNGETYYWRVAAENSCGAQSAWSTVYHFTTIWQAPPPTLTGPADAASCQATTLDVTWGEVTGATSYQLLVDNDDDFSSPTISEFAVFGTSHEISGLSHGTTYYWMMRSHNSCAESGPWATPFSFTTSMPVPGTASLSSPSDGAECQPVSPSMSWGAASNAHRYMLQVDNNSDFSSPEYYKDDVGGTSQAVSGLSEGETYHWRVKAVNGCGGEGSWSSVNDFSTTISSVSTPALSAPADAATCQSTSTSLSWGSATNADSYAVQVDNNSDFSSPVVDQSVSGTSYNCSGLAENTMYYWRVKGENDCGAESGWTSARSFETGTSGMDVPSLTAPANMSSGQALTLNLSWGAVGDATGYHVQLDDDDDFSSPVLDEEVSETSVEASGLDEATSYYWHVQSLGECASSEWSDSWEFETHDGGGPDALEVEEGLQYALKQNHPNPFTGSSLVEFTVPVAGEVTFELINLQGKLINSTTRFYNAGQHNYELIANEDIQAGAYLYRMKCDGYTETRLCIIR